MPHFLRLYLRLLPLCALACVCGVYIVVVFGTLLTLFSPTISIKHFAENIALAAYIGMFAMFIGIGPCVLYGGIAYTTLLWQRSANYISVFCIGILPGICLAMINLDWGVMFAVFGVPVALCTHFLAFRSARLATTLMDLGLISEETDALAITT